MTVVGKKKGYGIRAIGYNWRRAGSFEERVGYLQGRKSRYERKAKDGYHTELVTAKADLNRMNSGSETLDEILGAQIVSGNKHGLGFYYGAFTSNNAGKFVQGKTLFVDPFLLKTGVFCLLVVAF